MIGHDARSWEPRSSCPADTACDIVRKPSGKSIGICGVKALGHGRQSLSPRLQAATSSGKPVLLRVEYEGGHMMGATRQEEDAKLADTYAFLFAQLSGTPSGPVPGP